MKKQRRRVRVYGLGLSGKVVYEDMEEWEELGFYSKQEYIEWLLYQSGKLHFEEDEQHEKVSKG